MKAHRQKIRIAPDHHLEVQLPPDFPAGEAELILLADEGPVAQQPANNAMPTAAEWPVRNLGIKEPVKWADAYEDAG